MVSRSSPRRGSWSVGWLAGWWLIGRWVVDWSASGRLVDTRLIGGWWTSAVSPPVVVGAGASSSRVIYKRGGARTGQVRPHVGMRRRHGLGSPNPNLVLVLVRASTWSERSHVMWWTIKLVSRNSWLYLFVMFIFLLIGLSLDIYLIVYTSIDIVLVYFCRYMWSMYLVVVNVYYVKQNKILVSFIHIYKTFSCIFPLPKSKIAQIHAEFF